MFKRKQIRAKHFAKREKRYNLRYLMTLASVCFLLSPYIQVLASNLGDQDPQVQWEKSIKPLVKEGKEVPDKYELTLDFLTKNGRNIQSQPLDIVFVTDLSSSMDQNDVGTNKEKRIYALKKVLGEKNRSRGETVGVVDALLKNPNNRISIVGFAGKGDLKPREIQKGKVYAPSDVFTLYSPNEVITKNPRTGKETKKKNPHPTKKNNDAMVVLPWSNNSSLASVKETIGAMPVRTSSDYFYDHGDKDDIGTGTNIHAGLVEAKELLKKSKKDRPNAKRVLILLSDGEGNMYYYNDAVSKVGKNGPAFNGYTVFAYNKPTEWFKTGMEKALTHEINEMASQIDGFYSVKFKYNQNDQDTISQIKTYISKANASIPNEVTNADDQTQLKHQLEDIARKIVPVGLRQVTIIDTLSKYVTLPKNMADANIRLVEFSKDGRERTLGPDEAVIKTTADGKGQVSLSTEFLPNFSIQDGLRYALRFTVESTQLAKDTIAGDGTVTRQDAKDGLRNQLYSNKEARIHYAYGRPIDVVNGQQKYEYEGGGNYRQQPHFSPSSPFRVPIKVEWQDLNGRPIKAPAGKAGVRISVYRKELDRQSGAPYRQSHSGETVTVAKGYAYEVKGEEVAGFNMTGTGGSAERPDFKVVYRELPSLKIVKTVDDDNKDRKEMKVQVAVDLPTKPGETPKPLNGTYGGQEFKRGTATVTLKRTKANTFEASLSHLPLQTPYRVTDLTDSSYKNTLSQAQGTFTSYQDRVVSISGKRLPSLLIKNEVTGDLANYLKAFPIKLTLTRAHPKTSLGEVKPSIIIGGKKQDIQFDKNGQAVYTLHLKRNETVQINDAEFDTQYRLEKTSDYPKGYVLGYQLEKGNKITRSDFTNKLSESQTLHVTHLLNSVPETGLSVSDSPTMMLFLIALASLGLVYSSGPVLSRRRGGGPKRRREK